MPFTYGRLILTGAGANCVADEFLWVTISFKYCFEMIFVFFLVGRVANDVLCSVE